MARPNSMTRQEAEAALGPRGTTQITSDNRGDCRKWLVACGVPSPYAGDMRLADLDAVYNDTADRELNAHLEAASATVLPFPTPAPAAAAPIVPQAGGSADKGAELIRLLNEAIAPKAPELDADAVREICRGEIDTAADRAIEKLRGLLPTFRIEIKNGENVITLKDAPRHKSLPHVLATVGAMVHVLLVGPAGSGKTTAAEQIAEALSLPFYQQGACTGAHDFLGFVDGHGHYHATPFRQAFQHGGVFLCDEIDAGDAAGTLIINAALANGHMAFPDQVEPVKRHADFRMIAAANTYGYGADRQYVGRNQLDGATLDRFAVFNWDYDEKLELALSPNHTWTRKVQKIRAGIFAEKARIIVSPRASINGARMLAAGVPEDITAEATIWKGCDAELRRRVETRQAA